MKRFLPVINYGFDCINRFAPELFSLVVRSYYQLNLLAGSFLQHSPPETDFRHINSLLTSYFQIHFFLLAL